MYTAIFAYLFFTAENVAPTPRLLRDYESSVIRGFYFTRTLLIHDPQFRL